MKLDPIKKSIILNLMHEIPKLEEVWLNSPESSWYCLYCENLNDANHQVCNICRSDEYSIITNMQNQSMVDGIISQIQRQIRSNLDQHL